jgi:hypothetical protein
MALLHQVYVHAESDDVYDHMIQQSWVGNLLVKAMGLQRVCCIWDVWSSGGTHFEFTMLAKHGVNILFCISHPVGINL